MSKLTSIQSKLATRVFQSFCSTITIKNISSTTDKWGDATTTLSSSTTAQAVPYNLFDSKESFEAFGDLQAGDMDMAISYDTVFSATSVIRFDSKDYLIKQIEKYPFADGNLAWIVRLSKVL